MANGATLELKDFKKDFKTEPTQRSPLPSNEGVSFCLDFVRALPLIEGDAPLPRPYRTGPTDSLNSEMSAWEAASDEAWDSIEDGTSDSQ